MTVTRIPLEDIGDLDGSTEAGAERPNSSFRETALPGFKKAVPGRRAVRSFDGTPIPQEAMRDCLRDAVLAPSSSNLQYCEIRWVRDVEKTRRRAELPMGRIDARGIARLPGLPPTAEVMMAICMGTGTPKEVLGPRTRLPFGDVIKEL